jgi:threonine/homoserine/homoserine lactone efflux protein
MDLVNFLIEVEIVSASGAFSPGPLTFAVINESFRKNWKIGLNAALGHALIEFPIILLVSLGVLTVFENIFLKIFIGFCGGIVLIIFGIMQFFEAKKISKENIKKSGKSGLFIGLIMSGLNPYFIIWWLTVGAKLIYDALNLLSIYGILIMYFSHVWMDFAWLIIVSYAAFKGKEFLSTKFYKFIFIILSILLIYFGIMFLIDAKACLTSYHSLAPLSGTSLHSC